MKIRKLIIPVAGLGTRFLPVTKSIPKEMLPIVDRPTIQILLEEAYEAGIEEVLFITSPRKESIIKHFKEDIELEKMLKEKNKLEELEEIQKLYKMFSISSIHQEKPLGSGHAINLGRNFINNEPFAVMYGDDLIKGGCALKELIKIYEKYNCNVIGVNEVPYEETHKYGIVSLKSEDSMEIEGLIEKPSTEEAPSNLAGLGRYIFKPEIFDALDKILPHENNEYYLTDGILELMKSQSFYAAKFSGTYYDIGSKVGYLKANIAYACDNEIIKKDLVEYLKNIL